MNVIKGGDPDLDGDLKEILGEDYRPRQFGEVPTKSGDWEMLCPNTKTYDHIVKVKGKIFKS